jgi:hypothetical protein
MSQTLLGGFLSATFNPLAGDKPTTVEYLVVAGGGGGNTYYSGGAGAGGLLTGAGFAVAAGSAITVTVGAGGAQGVAGQNSVFSTITATGGGIGGRPTANMDGGSGGGGGWSTTVNEVSGTGVSGQGNAGGTGLANGNGACAGGGGAGSVGLPPFNANPTFQNGGNGGTGLCSTITGARVFYAGGGGAGCENSSSSIFGLGNSGGGNGGGAGAAGTSAIPNTGSGGGGGGTNGATSGNAGNGGSGIVIIRYPANCAAPTSTTGNPQILYADNYQIYIWTSNGTVTF